MCIGDTTLFASFNSGACTASVKMITTRHHPLYCMSEREKDTKTDAGLLQYVNVE